MKKLLALLIMSLCISNLAKSYAAVFFELGAPAWTRSISIQDLPGETTELAEELVWGDLA